MSLTPAQIKLMEENRRKAMEKRAAKMTAPPNTVMNHQNKDTFSSTKSSIFSPNSCNKGTTSASFYSAQKLDNNGKSTWNTPASSSKQLQTNVNRNNPTPFKGSSNRPVVAFQLISRSKFCIEAPFDNEMIEIFKKFPSKSYDGTNRKWTFPLADHQRVLTSLDPLISRFQIQPLPKFVLDVFR